METESNLTAEEFDVLVNLKEEHQPYFDAMIYSAGVIVDRNHKYTGDEKDRDVFANFILDAQIQNKSVQEILRQWISKKTARIMLNDGNYEDESFTDSLRDLVNYTLLYIGWLSSLKSTLLTSGMATYQSPKKEDLMKPTRVRRTLVGAGLGIAAHPTKTIEIVDRIKE